LDKNKSQLATIQDINKKLFEDYEPVSQLKLKSLDEFFCDGMLFPITEHSKTIANVKHLFEAEGIVIKTVKPSMRAGYWFIKLCENSSPSLSTVKLKTM